MKSVYCSQRTREPSLQWTKRQLVKLTTGMGQVRLRSEFTKLSRKNASEAISLNISSENFSQIN